MLISKSVSEQFEFLALDLEVSKTLCMTVSGCYRAPSAVRDALPSLVNLLSDMNFNGVVFIGDLNWNCHNQCLMMNLFQLVNSPTRPNLKCPEKSTLVDLILTTLLISTQLTLCLQMTLVIIVLLPQYEMQKSLKPNLVLLQNEI